MQRMLIVAVVIMISAVHAGRSQQIQDEVPLQSLTATSSSQQQHVDQPNRNVRSSDPERGLSALCQPRPSNPIRSLLISLITIHIVVLASSLFLELTGKLRINQVPYQDGPADAPATVYCSVKMHKWQALLFNGICSALAPVEIYMHGGFALALIFVKGIFFILLLVSGLGWWCEIPVAIRSFLLMLRFELALFILSQIAIFTNSLPSHDDCRFQ
uniref:TRP C-terminal domain-containing protein n=1 Tax=Spongospora subterranea TaxID=70186 RepID=A0A0H5R436_9EUKA|eukprot:CRZ08970.1 hypothetical protein [Spongospora subterranea]